MSKQNKKSVAVKASQFESMVSNLTVQPSTPVVTEGKVVSSVPSKSVATEIATLDKDKDCTNDSIKSLVSQWDTYTKDAVDKALKLAHRLGRVMFHIGYDKLDATVIECKQQVKDHFKTEIDAYTKEHGAKKWSQTPSYKNGLKPIAEARTWVFPEVKTALQIANDKTAKAKKEKEKQAARVESLSLGEDGQVAISACRKMVARMISSAHSVDGLIVMTDSKQALWEKGFFQVLSNFLKSEKIAEGKTETPALGVTVHTA